ncbi:Syd protein [Streptomyces sp. NBRC 110611]|uniref:pilus assembly protein TadG-related protein n=1 Tax=Streptomyces sp. NBRC 110611 TaxID=1621259 RepID=UPI0008576B48|nr:pilus assembly protein TadG-related protein [Streptomyces sp. NBRC 110611]GAU65183.1 Syd protein [Streptomyces sp. NBRC 110611]
MAVAATTASVTATVSATTTRRDRRDAGQAFPLYVVAVGGLLFLALAFFAVGQAAATRNGAQTAADAAALAAGHRYRELLTKDLLDGLRDGRYDRDRAAWEDLLNGRGTPSAAACTSADWFAGRNDAGVTSCTPDSWPTSFAVTVKSLNPVGRSVIPGTAHTHASAEARSVVGARCAVTPDADAKGGDAPEPEPKPGPEPGRKPGPEPAPKPGPVTLTCDGKRWTLDPDHLHDLPDATDLFSVRLAH